MSFFTKFEISNFIVEDNASYFKRGIVFILALLCWFFGKFYLSPSFGTAVSELYSNFQEGPRLSLSHILPQTWPMFIICLCLIVILYRKNIIKLPMNEKSMGLVIKEGVLWGIIVSLIPFILVPIFNLQLGFNFDLWKIMGNLFSNGYEELLHRGLIFSASLYCFRKIGWALLITAIVFGVTHNQYPIPIQIISGIVGLLFAISYTRSGSLLSPWIAHQLSDIIGDTFVSM